MLRWIKAARSRYATRRQPRRQPRWQPRWQYPDFELVARVEPPIEFTAPPPMPEAELEALQRRAHP